MKKRSLNFWFLCISYLSLLTARVYAQSDSILEKSVVEESILTNIGNNTKLLVIGETHLKPKNDELVLNLFKQFYKQTKCKILFLEMGYTSGFLLNKFLESGNEKYLYSVDVLPSSLQGFRRLREFYQSLPTSERFFIVGVDREISLQGFVNAMHSLLPKDLPPPEIKSIIEDFFYETTEINTNYIFDPFVSKKYVNRFYFALKKYPEQFKLFLGDAFYDFYKIVCSQMCSPFYMKGRDSNRSYLYHREIYLFENIIEIIKKYPSTSYFAHFGATHVSLKFSPSWCGLTNWESFTSMLNSYDSSPIRGRVMSGVIYYGGSKNKLKKIYVNKSILRRTLKKNVRIVDYIPEEHFGVENKYFDFLIVY